MVSFAFVQFLYFWTALAAAVVSATEPVAVSPVDVTPPATSFLVPHLVYTPPAAATSGSARLFVFLPGTTARPSFYRTFGDAMAALGYRTVLLSYPNGQTVNELCQHLEPADECYRDVRLETLTGDDVSDKVEVAPADSIRGRLVALLLFLARRDNDASESGDASGWRRYLTPDGRDVNWERVVISGHSLGAGHAAFIGTLHRCARVIAYGGPTDLPWSNKPVAWTASTPATPVADWYAYYTKYEFVCKATHLNTEREKLGLYGDLVDVYGDGTDFHGSHWLCSSLDPGWWLLKGTVSHGDYIAEYMLDDRQRFGDVWRYLATFGNCSDCRAPAACSPTGACVAPGEGFRRHTDGPHPCACEPGVSPFVVKWWLIRLLPPTSVAVVVAVAYWRRRQRRAQLKKTT